MVEKPIVMVIDDCKEILSLCSAFFDNLGMESLLCADYDFAKDLASNYGTRINGALIDYSSHDLTSRRDMRDSAIIEYFHNSEQKVRMQNGIQFAEFLKVHRPEIFVCIMSGHGREDIPGISPYRFLHKPLRLDQVADAFRSLRE